MASKSNPIAPMAQVMDDRMMGSSQHPYAPMPGCAPPAPGYVQQVPQPMYAQPEQLYWQQTFAQQPPQQAGAGQANYQNVTVVMPQPVAGQPAPTQQVIYVQSCQHKLVEDGDFTLAGLCLGFWFFPIGVVCCLVMREKRCQQCKARVG